MSDNPKLKKNGGPGTKVGNFLRGLVSVGKTISPKLKSIIDAFEGEEDFESIESQLAKEGFDDNELQFLLEELSKDKVELQEITKRWVSDNDSDSWLAKNVRPATLVLYNVAVIAFIALDSWVSDFTVKDIWLNILISNSGIVNTAYFGSRYLEKRDKKKYK